MDRELVVGGFYKHFKNKLYQVKCVAYHSETKEKMVVYQALYGDYSVYVRPYDMFLSEVDHVKYPEVKQTYRFEQVNPEDFSPVVDTVKVEVAKETVHKEEVAEPSDMGTVNIEQEQADVLEAFLDAYGYDKKLDVLMKSKSKLTNGMIDVMAESLEIVVPEGDISSRYDSLRKCLMAHTKYEGARLRQ